ncbi:hypothetical protein [Pseudoramibacter alactolyticus]|uniref:hypothetical protein n=1 Tax=Pseudoramibacter alactolyticus TaxID=113287 RepID=UPI0028E71241|nr:hypothetical protein [Pseudoramibacter alactolyticus]
MRNQSGKDIAIGFVTGRKGFRKLLTTYAFRWRTIVAENNLNIHLIVAYDLDYNHTKIEDYVALRPDVRAVFASVSFIGPERIRRMVKAIADAGILPADQAARLFEKGYAGKRNSVLFEAIRHKMNALIFLDDDEYPLAVTHENRTALWSGQDVFSEHVLALGGQDVTNGYHCGYISPIPHLDFDATLSEGDFKTFIEAVSNEAFDWDGLKKIMAAGGVTYADVTVLKRHQVRPLSSGSGDGLPLSGSNLGINLRRPERIPPFFNPPGARGEDTFFALALDHRQVARVPVYTFHDGFMQYPHLLSGVLPLHLKRIEAADAGVAERFYRACLGWIRYKPLYQWLTSKARQADFSAAAKLTGEQLRATLSKIAAYFHVPAFMRLEEEYEKFRRHVYQDAQMFQINRQNWQRLIGAL